MSENATFTPAPADVLSPSEISFLSEVKALSPSGNIAQPGKIAVRSFHLQGRNASIVGLVIQELNDGYIVALPSQIMKLQRGDIQVNFVTDVPLAKLHKPSVDLMTLPTQSTLVHYLKYLSGKTHLLPGYFTKGRVTQIESLVEQLSSISASPVAIPSPSDARTSSTPSAPHMSAKKSKAPSEVEGVQEVSVSTSPSPEAFYIGVKRAKYLH